MTDSQFHILTRMIKGLEEKIDTKIDTTISALRDELKQHTVDVVHEAMGAIGENLEVFEADYLRTKNDHELRLLRLEQKSA